MSATQQVPDLSGLGKKGLPMHYQAFGIQPPMKTVPVEQGEALVDHPGMSVAEYIAAKRWEREVGGIELDGLAVATDDRSKMMISGARVAAQNNPEFATQWKASDGTFLMLDAQTIIAISDAVLEHVARCFAIEASIILDLQMGAVFTFSDIDQIFVSHFPNSSI